jgi:riboflavin synthase
MFSGIIEEKAQVKKILKNPQGCKLTVDSELISKDTKTGDSISVNGVCLTVVEIRGTEISFDIMEETLRRTSLTKLSSRQKVNLERALKVGDKISGHFVTGHVDCIGKIRDIKKRTNDYAIDIGFPGDKKAYLTEKGSIAIDGVSLTVVDIEDSHLRVNLIPLTLKATTLGFKKVNDIVNIEFDILSKYSLKISPLAEQKKRINTNFLKEHGFL